jgi:hypothetical protein
MRARLVWHADGTSEDRAVLTSGYAGELVSPLVVVDVRLAAVCSLTGS